MLFRSPGILHKTEAGAVRLHLSTPHEVRDAAIQMRDQLAAQGHGPTGFLLQRMAKPGVEMIVGVVHDPQFGPVVLVGDGGIHMELLKDFALLMPPFDAAEVHRKLERLRVAPLLAGLDIARFADMAVRLGEAALAWREAVASIDVNPVMLFETGSGAVALDALVERAAIIPA